MRLIGMLDSPYVRRVAITMRMAGIPFTHEPLSILRDIEAFRATNPVIKAPTLITEAGIVLMDSTLILAHLAELHPERARLMPTAPDAHARACRILGLALAAADKTVQLAYERNLRPEEKQYAPWLDRIHGQLSTAYAELEREVGGQEPWLFGPAPLQPDITAAVVCRFTRSIQGDAVSEAEHPNLAALCARAEALPAFQACPFR
ncbi:glutathione S-transferase family protein [Methylobacterium pseudosasicola]|uniref:Glutathione S-transferase n=1 Tax=Methylobacterium pseudosasicola TaxID=582667 RepID=A0A1I4NYS9_9HYPH|nr:glutathione S-transferase [Methylobacterium pseudosasicola]SFM20678.1 Glutathione S-transferase [Methylobacterium pseudosasicola]